MISFQENGFGSNKNAKVLHDTFPGSSDILDDVPPISGQDDFALLRAQAHEKLFFINANILKRYSTSAPIRRLELDQIVFIMMASSLRPDLARFMRATYLRAAPHVFIVGDVHDASVPMFTLPELHGRPSKLDAQHRQLRAMKYIYEKVSSHESVRYFVLIGNTLTSDSLLRMALNYAWSVISEVVHATRTCMNVLLCVLQMMTLGSTFHCFKHICLSMTSGFHLSLDGYGPW